MQTGYLPIQSSDSQKLFPSHLFPFYLILHSIYSLTNTLRWPFHPRSSPPRTQIHTFVHPTCLHFLTANTLTFSLFSSRSDSYFPCLWIFVGISLADVEPCVKDLWRKWRNRLKQSKQKGPLNDIAPALRTLKSEVTVTTDLHCHLQRSVHRKMCVKCHQS